jgi:Mg-chelatase subunit ChlD
VAIAVLAFSDDVRPLLDWRVLSGPPDARAAGAELRLAARPTPAGTDIGAALWAGLDLLATAPCQAEREVIDLVTDGEAPVEGVLRARAYAEAQGVAINALAVGPEAAEAWLRANAATPAGFVLRADGWASFAPALRRKLLMELASHPGDGVQAAP